MVSWTYHSSAWNDTKRYLHITLIHYDTVSFIFASTENKHAHTEIVPPQLCYRPLPPGALRTIFIIVANLACWRIAWSPERYPQISWFISLHPKSAGFLGSWNEAEWPLCCPKAQSFPTRRSSALKWYYGWPWPSVLKPMVSSKFSELNPGFTQWIWDYNPTSVEDSSDTWTGVLVNSLAQLNNYCHEDRNHWKSLYFHGHEPRILG